VAQLVRARLSEQEVPGSILGDLKRLFRLSSDPIQIFVKRSNDRGRGVKGVHRQLPLIATNDVK